MCAQNGHRYHFSEFLCFRDLAIHYKRPFISLSYLRLNDGYPSLARSRVSIQFHPVLSALPSCVLLQMFRPDLLHLCHPRLAPIFTMYIFLATFPRFVSPLRVHGYAEIGGIDRPHKCGTVVETVYFGFIINSPRELGSGNER